MPSLSSFASGIATQERIEFALLFFILDSDQSWPSVRDVKCLYEAGLCHYRDLDGVRF